MSRWHPSSLLQQGPATVNVFNSLSVRLPHSQPASQLDSQPTFLPVRMSIIVQLMLVADSIQH